MGQLTLHNCSFFRLLLLLERDRLWSATHAKWVGWYAEIKILVRSRSNVPGLPRCTSDYFVGAVCCIQRKIWLHVNRVHANLWRKIWRWCNVIHTCLNTTNTQLILNVLFFIFIQEPNVPESGHKEADDDDEEPFIKHLVYLAGGVLSAVGFVVYILRRIYRLYRDAIELKRDYSNLIADSESHIWLAFHFQYYFRRSGSVSFIDFFSFHHFYKNIT